LASNAFPPDGVIAACVTPFHEDEALDLDGLGSHIDFMLERGIKGVMVAGGCGEYANLTPEERRQVVTQSVKVVDGRAVVVAGALGPSTREVVELGQHAAREGVDALLVLPPYYIKPSFDGVMKHFETVVRETGLDVIVYNNPGRTGWMLGLEHLRELAGLRGIVALKECERDMASISGKITGLNGRMAVLSGDDDLGFATILHGGTSAIWASPNIAPRLAVDLYEACAARDVGRALPLHNRLLALFTAFMLPNHPGPLKQAMAMAGRPVGPARTPLAPMSDAQVANLRAALEANGPIE
jgi:4-hydroxy-tetrahydrodipicolinate synthase